MHETSEPNLKGPDANSNENSFEKLLDLARTGDAEAIGALLQNHRDYLLLVANQEMDQKIKGKLGSSDVVQESLMTAHQKFGQFRGDSREELLAWLRQIVKHDLLHARRTYTGTQKRQINREQPIQVNSSLEHPLVDQQMTPATNAMALEEKRQLDQAMSQIPEDYQQVLRLYSWQQQSFEEVGDEMGRSPEAARKLWTRAVIKLQEVIGKTQNVGQFPSNPK